MITISDSHIHTNISRCCKEQTFTAEVVVERAAETGLKIAGISNHVWDTAVGNNCGHYTNGDFSDIIKIKEEIPGDKKGVKLLIGCETDISMEKKLGITREHASELDYVLVPSAHFHLTGLTVPEGRMTPKECAALLVRRFREICEFDYVNAIAHTFQPKGYGEEIEEILENIPDSEAEKCFRDAAAAGIAVEIHSGHLGFLWNDNKKSRSVGQKYVRFLKLARNLGCLFTFGSDTHKSQFIGMTGKMIEYAQSELGLTSDNVHPIFRG